ncbi:MAG: hypothetical protein HQM00_17160, partial [Magnetococcales bacterium]|nr:hypothetical protein [Magnetococcales bacterium]
MLHIFSSRRSGVCRPSTLLACSLLLLVPWRAEAFSLGEMRLQSALGEPFAAEIPLSIGVDEAHAELSVTVATQDAYRLMELERPSVVADLSVKLKADPAQPRRVIIQGSTPVNEPFFYLLIQGSAGRGSQVRAYRVLLDPSPRVYKTAATPSVQSGLLASGAARTEADKSRERSKPAKTSVKSATPARPGANAPLQ